MSMSLSTMSAAANLPTALQPQPTNKCELELYQLLNQANLLQYYEAFIMQGGDDIRQMHDASEEEFLEITVLVGMASKPLHVRRLQKHLSEWHKLQETAATSVSSSFCATNGTTGNSSSIDARRVIPPSIATSATLMASSSSVTDAAAAAAAAHSLQQSLGGAGGVPVHLAKQPLPSVPIMHSVPAQTQAFSTTQPSLFGAANTPSLLAGAKYYNGMMSDFNAAAAAAAAAATANESMGLASMPSLSGAAVMTPGSGAAAAAGMGGGSANGPGRPRSQHNGEGVPVSMLPKAELTPEQLSAMMVAAEQLVLSLPQYPVKPLNPRKQLHRDIEAVILMAPDDPLRLEQIRKFSAIYGRFDALRKTGKPMSLHEVSVNAAAAQICCHMPSLLTRRDDLFPLARQVVKMAGIQNPGTAGGCATSPVAGSSMQLPTMVPSSGGGGDCGGGGGGSYAPAMFVGGHPALLGLQTRPDGPLSKRLRTHASLSLDEHDSFGGGTGGGTSAGQADRLAVEARLDSIKVELADVIGKSDELRESIRAVKPAGDAALLTRLQKCSDLLSIRHNNLLQEQTGLLRSLQCFQSTGASSLIGTSSGLSSDNGSDHDGVGAGTTAGDMNDTADDGAASRDGTINLVMGSGRGSEDETPLRPPPPLQPLQLSRADVALRGPPASSLFEAGMQLAQQFGFDGLATEIKGLKSAEEDDSREKVYDEMTLDEEDDVEVDKDQEPGERCSALTRLSPRDESAAAAADVVELDDEEDDELDATTTSDEAAPVSCGVYEAPCDAMAATV